MSHSREPSTGSSTSSGSSYRLILEHVLSYPGSYELPLRTMYTLNCISRAQPLPHHISRPSTPQISPSPSPTSPTFPDVPPAQAATAQFTSALFNQVARLPSQPCSLPPVFINSFLRRCFPSELVLIDFPQALTALDYLKDLETRRRRELGAAFHRIGVERDQLNADGEALWKQNAHPREARWVEDMERSEAKVEALYTQLYVALRRWILINELSLTPFNKHNCLAMLNTLYPPTSTSRPTTKLTTEILKRQRDTFFRYIQAVERRGSSVLLPLIKQNTNAGDENGWPRVRLVLDSYLRVATTLIQDCMQITDVDDLISAANGRQSWSKRQDRKADSAISLGPSDRPVLGDVDDRKRSPDQDSTEEAPPKKRHYSTLARMAQELRKLRTRVKAAPLPSHSFDTDKDKLERRDSRADSARDVVVEAEPQPEKGKEFNKTIRRLRSLGDVRSLSRSSSFGRTGAAVPLLPGVSQSFG